MIETGKFTSILDSSLAAEQSADLTRSAASAALPGTAETQDGAAGAFLGRKLTSADLPEKSIWSTLWARFRGKDRPVSRYHQVALKLNHSLSLPGALPSALLVSPRFSAAATEAALELGICLAEELQRRVLLVDARSDGKGVSKLLQCAPAPGYLDLLAGSEKSASTLVHPTNYAKLSFLPAGAPTEGSRNAVPSVAQDLLQKLLRDYEIVLIAGGPVLTDPQTLAIAPCTGVVLMFAEGNETRLEDLNAAQDALTFCQVRELGVVLVS